MKRVITRITILTAMTFSVILGLMSLLLLFTRDGQITGMLFGFFCAGLAAFAKNLAEDFKKGK